MPKSDAGSEFEEKQETCMGACVSICCGCCCELLAFRLLLMVLKLSDRPVLPESQQSMVFV